MDNTRPTNTSSFLAHEHENLDYSIFQLNLILNAYSERQKPYKIDYNVLLLSYSLWKGGDIDEFCQDQTIGYFLLNPSNDSAEAREAFCMEIREFLLEM